MKRKLLIGIIFSTVFLFLALKDVDWAEFTSVLGRTKYIYVIPAVLFTLITVFFRAYRWKFMILPMRSVPFSRLLTATYIGFMANNILPARLGEVVRAYVLGKIDGISKTSAFATIVYERIIDVFALLVLLWIMLINVPGPDWVRRGGITLLAANVLLLLLLFFFQSRRELAQRIMGTLTRPLRDSWRTRILKGTDSFLEGLKVLGKVRMLVPILLTSIPVWFTALAVVFFCFGALDLELPLIGSITLIVFILLGSMIPSAPAYIGTTQYACVLGLGIFGIDKGEALAFSILYHASVFFPITILGLILLWKTHIGLSEVSRKTVENDSHTDYIERD